MAVKEDGTSEVDSSNSNLKNLSDFEWNVENEVQLFYAMNGHKPVGVNKYFHMACISEKFNNALNREVSSTAIWRHLESMYDMQALDESEVLPFPNNVKEFFLPQDEFGYLLDEKPKFADDSDDEKQNGKIKKFHKEEIYVKEEASVQISKKGKSREHKDSESSVDNYKKTSKRSRTQSNDSTASGSSSVKRKRN